MMKLHFFGWLLFLSVIGYVAIPARAEWVPAVVYKEKAYLFGKPEQILPADVGQVQASPKGRYLLAVCNSPAREPFAALLKEPIAANPLVTLSLYDAVRRRTTALWKAADDSEKTWYGNSIRWLADGETALVVIRRRTRGEDVAGADEATKPQYTYSLHLLLVNAVRGTARELPLAEEDAPIFEVGISPSPTRNEAIVTTRADRVPNCEARLIQASGLISAPVPLSATYLVESCWKPDGTLWGQLGSRPGNDKVGEDLYGYAIFDRSTKTVREQQEKPEWFQEDEGDSPEQPESFLTLDSHGTTFSVDNLQQATRVLVVETEDHKDKTMLALDATEVSVLGGKEAPVAIYKSKNALYSIAAHPVAYSDYVALARQEVEANARQVLSAIQQWMKDNAVESFAGISDPAPRIVGRYIVRDTPLRDPHTSALAFKNVFNGKPDASGNTPLFTLKTSVGTLTTYQSPGTFRWSD